MHEHPSARPRFGYVVVLIGAAGFVVSCFLPYYAFGPSWLSLFDALYVPRSTGVGQLGRSLFLFAGVATVAWLAIAGIRAGWPWTPYALAAVATAWSLTWIGTFLTRSSVLPSKRFGYWFLLVSIGVVVAGTIWVWVSARPRPEKLRDTPVPGE